MAAGCVDGRRSPCGARHAPSPHALGAGGGFVALRGDAQRDGVRRLERRRCPSSRRGPWGGEPWRRQRHCFGGSLRTAATRLAPRGSVEARGREVALGSWLTGDEGARCVSTAALGSWLTGGEGARCASTAALGSLPPTVGASERRLRAEMAAVQLARPAGRRQRRRPAPRQERQRLRRDASGLWPRGLWPRDLLPTSGASAASTRRKRPAAARPMAAGFTA